MKMNLKMPTAFALLLVAVSCLSGIAVAYEPPDTFVLESFIEYANDAKNEPGESEYSKLIPIKKTEFDQALEDAESLIIKIKAGEPVMQTEVDSASVNLMNCIHCLGFSAGNKTALIILINECETTYTDESIFTPESWAAYEYALQEAISTRDDENAMQDEVNDAYDRLENARSELVMAWIPVDKSALIELVNECEMTYVDENKYTADSWNPYQDALMNAVAMIDKFDATQAEVDEAHAILAINRPTLKPDSGGNKSTGGSGSGTGQATVSNPMNNSGSVQNEAPGTSYSNPLEEQTDVEQNPKGVFLFPWLILLVLIIAGVIYYRNHRNSEE